MLVLSTVEAQLSSHKHNIFQKHGNARKPNPEPRSETAGVAVLCTLCHISKLHDDLCQLAVPVRMHQCTSGYAYSGVYEPPKVTCLY